MLNNLQEIFEFYCGVVFQVLIIGQSLFLISTTVYTDLLKRYNRTTSYLAIERKLILLFGSIYLVSFILLTLLRLHDGEQYGIKYSDRYFGTYSYAYWTFPTIYILITFLRQIKVKYGSTALLILSILSLIPMETIVITFALSEDFLTSSAYSNSLWYIWIKLLRNYLLCFLLYGIVLEITYRIKMKFR